MALKKKRSTKKKIVKKSAPKKKPVKKLKPKVKSRVKAKTIKAKKSSPSPKKKPSVRNDNVIGKIIHYFPHVKAAVIKLSAPLSIGEKIKIKGHTTDFTQVITSMQMDRVDITSAKPKEEIGLLVNSRVRQHDTVYKI